MSETPTLEVTCGICGGNNHIEVACPRGRDTPRTDELLQLMEAGRFTVFEALPRLQELTRQLEREITKLKAHQVPTAPEGYRHELVKIGS